MAEIGHFGRRGVRVDRAADQGQRVGLRRRVDFSEVGGGGQDKRGRLADRDHVDVRAQLFHEIDNVEGVILDIELAFRDGDVPGVVPVGDIDLGIGQERHDRGPQEGRVMAGHRGDQQDLAVLFLAALDVEVDQVTEGAGDHGFDRHQVVAAVLAGHRMDAPVGLGHHPLEGTFRHLAPGGHPVQGRVGDKREGRVGSHRESRRAQPLVGVADRLHKIVSCHIAHVRLPGDLNGQVRRLCHVVPRRRRPTKVHHTDAA